MGKLLPRNYNVSKPEKWEVEEEVRVIPCRNGSASLPGPGSRGKGQEPGDKGATEEREVKDHYRASLEGNSLANTSLWPSETNMDCLIHMMVR